jgi:hypothetical protein
MRTRFPHSRDRRGVLLLLVLSVLTLFLMLGAIMLVLATRARTTARAFANATNTAAIPTLQAQAALDEALMVLLRGSQEPAVQAKVTESILHDKYGAPLLASGSAAINLDPANPLPMATLVNCGAVDSRRLFGRVITFLPPPSDAMNPVSFRIVGASGSNVYLANVPGRPSLSLSGSYGIRINGREFTPEPPNQEPETWDGYDDRNPWLAQPAVSGSGTIRTFLRCSFGTGGAADVDNDNDGVVDGVFLDDVIADRPSPNGGTLRCKVSYLVLDLDGRINVNAAGMPSQPGSYAVPGVPTGLPIGMGYGPADIDPSYVVSSTPSPPVSGQLSPFVSVSSETPWRMFLSGSSFPTLTALPSPTDYQRRPPPQIEMTGRYGRDGVPGGSGDDFRGNQQTTNSGTAIISGSTYRHMVAGTNAVADLKGRARVYMSATTGQITPVLNYFVPQVSGTFADEVNDPYEVRLDALGPRPAVALSGATALNDDNPFAVAEMEWILRPFDTDTPALPQRLAGALGSIAECSRMRITTDSWDTPAMTGTAAQLVEKAFKGGACGTLTYPWTDANPASPDVAAGLRFNINRPITTPTHAQEYCKGLYSLVRALNVGNPGITARMAAQWAVNVCDFRDDDSIMTRFDYDPDLSNGWDSPSAGDTVFGVEKPELLIAETAAWRDSGNNLAQLFVNVHRPAYLGFLRTGSSIAPSGTSTLATGGTLALNTWQLRFGANACVRFANVGATGSSATQHVLTGTGVQTRSINLSGGSTGFVGLAETGSAAYLCVQPAGSQGFSAAGIPTFTVDQGPAFRFPPNAASGTVTLERLANPSQPHGPANPFVVVDVAVLDNIPDVSVGATILGKNVRRMTSLSGIDPLASFWRQAWISPPVVTGTTLMPLSGTAPWFHWPNRPFISQAELALVPADDAESLLRNYDLPTSSLASQATGLLLDATYVPSRFAGCAITVTGPAESRAAECGLNRLNAGHFSTWREPGRVNVNTVPGISGTSEPLVWATLVGGTSQQLMSGTSPIMLSPNPFVATGSAAAAPARSTAQLLSLSGSANQPIATGTFDSTDPGLRGRNPYFMYATANRLANTATVRSNVFAVWITVQVTDDSATAPSTTVRRMFAIVDRSIPVGYSPGEDLNVRDTIRLQRYLD